MTGDVTVSDDEREEGSSFLSHLPAIFKQRRWLIIIPAAICAMLGILAAFLRERLQHTSINNIEGVTRLSWGVKHLALGQMPDPR